MTLARWLCLIRNFSIIICLLAKVVKSQYFYDHNNLLLTTQITTQQTTITINTTTTVGTTRNLTFDLKVKETIAQVQKFHDDIVKQKWCTSVTIAQECPNSNVSFWLYNKNMVGPYLLDETHMDSILQAPFIPKSPIKILLHGFAGNKSYSPNKEIRPKYISKGYNVISIDYKNVVPHPCYIQAATNLIRVGKCLAEFISNLVNAKLKSRKIRMEDIHVVGFCLGAQVAGKAASVLAEEDLHFSRVSALDASLPLFHGMVNFISKYTAKFVDASHTNIVITGKVQTIGHVDFYFSDAVFDKRLCKLSDPSCTRGMSAAYFAESVTTLLPLCGYDLLGGAKFAVMGEYTPLNTTGMYLVMTNKYPPYAKGCYKDLLHKEYRRFRLNTTHAISF